MFELEERIAVVTGGGGARVGTGAGIARTVAGQGAYVVVADKNEAAAEATVASITEAGGRAEVEVFDVRDEAVVLEKMGALEARLGRIDILINSAGGDRRPSSGTCPRASGPGSSTSTSTGWCTAPGPWSDGDVPAGVGPGHHHRLLGRLHGVDAGAAYAAGKAGAVGFTRQLAGAWSSARTG